MNNKTNDYLTQAPKHPEKQMTVDNDGRFPNLRNYPGDSVNEHESLETANAVIGKGEIGQQKENL
jgi:hypothetical protein